MKSIQVSLEERSYSIQIGSGILKELGSIVQGVAPSSRYFFILDEAIESTHGKNAMGSFSQETDAYVLQSIETNKTVQSIQDIWSSMISYGCDRDTPLIAVGGGLVGDVGTISYGSSKAALMFSTKTMATELGIMNIRVNAIAPSITKTDMSDQMEEKIRNKLIPRL